MPTSSGERFAVGPPETSPPPSRATESTSSWSVAIAIAAIVGYVEHRRGSTRDTSDAADWLGR